MERQFTPPQTGSIDPSSIKQQFQQMNQAAEQQSAPQQQQMTQEQADKQRKEQEKKLKDILPYMRLQAEATELEMKLVRYDVLLGRVNPQSIPGPYGKQLEDEMTEIQIKWATSKMESSRTMTEALKQKKELEQLQKEDSEATNLQTNGWTVTFLKDFEYNGHVIYNKDKDIVVRSLTPQVTTVEGTLDLDIIKMEIEGIVKISK